MVHREEREFIVHLHLSAEFDEAYDGEEDGFAWHDEFDRVVRPRIVAAVFEALRKTPGWTAVDAPRGRHPSDAIDIAVSKESGAHALHAARPVLT
jgi:hypothetical protein